MNRPTGIKDFTLTSTEDVEVILWVLGTRSHLPEQLEGVDLGCGKFCTFTKHGLFKDVIWCWYYLPKNRRPWGICLRHLRFGEWVSTLLKRPSKVALKIFWWRTKTRINTVINYGHFLTYMTHHCNELFHTIRQYREINLERSFFPAIAWVSRSVMSQLKVEGKNWRQTSNSPLSVLILLQ